MKNLVNMFGGRGEGLAPLYEATSVDLRVTTSVHFGDTYNIDSQVRYPVLTVVKRYVWDSLDDIWER